MGDELKTRLLVVDDEQSIRRLCMTIGTSLGYDCAEAEAHGDLFRVSEMVEAVS